MGQKISREINDGEICLKYIIEKKKIKNLILKIRPDQSIWVSSPLRLSLAKIDEFVLSKYDWIEKKRRVLAKKEENRFDMNQNAEVKILGKKYQIKILPSTINKVEFWEDKILVYSKKHESIEYNSELFNSWKKNYSNEVFKDSFDRVFIKMSDYETSNLVVKSWKMKKRWGTCYPGRKIIHLNTHLIHAPIEIIDYVLMHEMVHLKHPDHSKKFYDELEIYCENWKANKSILNLEYALYLK
ncbi:MAG: SprT family zinc-dependent metalloprotease [Bacillota bacterium]|nr:SprT family zinc-dependent metalloprotease [Bacillota bacterium]